MSSPSSPADDGPPSAPAEAPSDPTARISAGPPPLPAEPIAPPGDPSSEERAASEERTAFEKRTASEAISEGPMIEISSSAGDSSSLDFADTPSEPPLELPLGDRLTPDVPPGLPAAAPVPTIDHPADPHEAPHTSPSIGRLVITAVLVTAADLGSKEWAKRTLATADLKRAAKHFEVVHDHMDFIFAQNPGGAWSFLRGLSDGIRRPFFLFVSAAAIVFIVTVYQRLEQRQWAMRWGLPLALGGAIGNLADRVRYGWVVDFVDVYTKRGGNELHWPTFNVADIAIVFGVGLMAMDLLSVRRHRPPPAPAASPEAA